MKQYHHTLSMLYKKYAILLLLICLMPLLAHCGRTSPQQNAQPAELQWITLDPTSQIEKTLAENYQSTNPHITFNRQQIDFNQNQITASPAPDLLMTFFNHAYLQASDNNQLTDLSEVWLNASLEQALVPNVQSLIQSEESGKPYMLPIAFAWTAIYYNKAIFDQYNLQVPQTWDEFMQICATLQANGEIPIVMAGQNTYHAALWFDYLNLRLNGADFHRGLIAGRERFDDPRVFTVLELWRNLFDQGFVVARPEFINATGATNALIRGDDGLLGAEKAVMGLLDIYAINNMPAEFRDEIGFFRFPIIDPTIPTAESIDVIGYIVPTAAPHVAEAQNFLTYIATAEAQELIAREASLNNLVFAPTRTDLNADALTDAMSQAAAMLQETDSVVALTNQTMPAVLQTEFMRAFRQLLGDKQDIHSFINSLESARQNAVATGEIQ